jgi:hypothetical protein
MTGGGLPSAASSPGGGRHHVRTHHVEWVAARLSERDWLVVEIINRLRLLRGDQLERLFFFSLSGRSKQVTRGRVLHRLVMWQVLDELPRRIGGSLRGSSGSVFALGLVGQRLIATQQLVNGQTRRVRHPGIPTDRTLAHTLAVSELYVGLREQGRVRGVQVVSFETEPACWWPNGLGGFIKPDAYVVLDSGSVRDHWWVEVDKASESLPTVKRKLESYLDFVARGQLGPSDVMPRVLFTVPSTPRRGALHSILTRLPDPAQELFHIATEDHAVPLLFQVLKE